MASSQRRGKARRGFIAFVGQNQELVRQVSGCEVRNLLTRPFRRVENHTHITCSEVPEFLLLNRERRGVGHHTLELFVFAEEDFGVGKTGLQFLANLLPLLKVLPTTRPGAPYKNPDFGRACVRFELPNAFAKGHSRYVASCAVYPELGMD